MLAFVPLSDADLRALGAGGTVPAEEGFAPTASFLGTFGLASPEDEDAERTLLYLAGLAALQRHGRRLVAVVDGARASGSDELGRIQPGPVAMGRVTALFADDAASADLVEAARRVTTAVDLTDAWETVEHEALLHRADLMWYGPEEWSVLVEG